MLSDHVQLAVRQIRGRWLESAIVALGVALGTGLAVSMLGIVISYLAAKATGANDPDLRVLWAQSSLNQGSYTAAVTRIGTLATPEVRFPLDMEDRVRIACPTVERAWAEVDFEFATEGQTRDIPARATTQDYFGALGLEAGSGSLFTKTDVDTGRQVLVLGALLAYRLKLDAGVQMLVNGAPYTVLGILDQDPDPNQDTPWGRNNLAYLPVTSAPIAQRPDWGTLAFSVDSAADIPRAQMELERFFTAVYGTDAVTVSAAATYVWDLARRMAPLISMVSVLASLSLLISALNGANIMLVQVVRRTRAMGIVRALGASRASLFLQVTTEGLLLGLGGGALGAACALGLQELVRLVLRSGALPGAEAAGLPAGAIIPASLGVAVLMSLMLALYPALRASRTDSATALRED
jgi:putative ABC transport system permease protein